MPMGEVAVEWWCARAVVARPAGWHKARSERGRWWSAVEEARPLGVRGVGGARAAVADVDLWVEGGCGGGGVGRFWLEACV